MKKTLLIATSVLFIAFTSCEKIKEATNQDVDITPSGFEFTLPVITATAEQSTFGETSISMNIDSLISAHSPTFGSKNVKSVKLTGFTMEILNGDNANNFSSFESIFGHLEAQGKSTEIVGSSTIPNINSSTLDLPVTGLGIELKGYVLTGSLKYTLKGKARKATTKPLRIKATAKYKFTLGL